MQEPGESDIQDDLDQMLEWEDNSVFLKQSINYRELCDGQGVEFEADNAVPLNYDDMTGYNQRDVYNHLNRDAIGLDDGQDEAVGGEEDQSPFTILGQKMENITDDGGVKKRVLKQGVGGRVPDNVEVKFHYQSYLEYCDEPNDSTRLRNSPCRYILGSGLLLPGLELAVCSMRRKEEAQFLIAPEYAFGERGCPPRIPPNVQFLFEVELIGWTNCTELQAFYKMPYDQRRTCDYVIIKEVVDSHNEEGKAFFKREQYKRASNCYNKSIKALEPFHPKDEGEENLWRKSLIRCYTNNALCQLHRKEFRMVIYYANRALSLDSNSCKALFYKGKALHRINEYSRAKEELLKAESLEPRNRSISDELQLLERSVQRELRLERTKCQVMFAPYRTESHAKDQTKGMKENTTTHPDMSS